MAEWIEHSDAHKLVEMVDDDEKVRNIVPTLGGNQEMWLLTEDEVTKLNLGSLEGDTWFLKEDGLIVDL